MAYQEGQYISQFLNTMPQQLATYAQQQEQTRQFDALQGLRESAEARTAEQYEHQKGQKALIDLLYRGQYAKNIEIAEAEERKVKALEGRGVLEKMGQLLPSGIGPKSIIDKLRDEIGFGLGRDPTSEGQYWSETDQEWAQRITDYDKVERGPMALPEGLQLSPEMYQNIGGLGGYQTPRQNLLNMIYGGR